MSISNESVKANEEEGNEKFFRIFDMVETARHPLYLEYLKRIISNREEFLKDYYKIRVAYNDKLHDKFVSLTKAERSDDKIMINRLSFEIKNLIAERIELDKKIEAYLDATKDILKSIENSSSPQEVDYYIALIEDEESLLFGNLEASQNPVRLRKLLRFLEQKELEAIDNEAYLKSNVGSAAISVVKPITEIPGLAVWIPDSLEEWPHHNISLEQIRSAIKECKLKIKDSTEKAMINLSGEERDLFEEKMNVLHALIQYAETSKNNFNSFKKRHYTSGWLYLNATLFSLFSIVASGLSAIASAFSLLPGLNLISQALKNTCEMVSFSSLTAAYSIDPTVPKAEKLATFRHYEALKKYSIAEVSLGMGGTLALAIGILLPVAIVAPALIVAGAGIMAISNFVSFVNSYLQKEHIQKLFDEHPLKNNMADIKKRWRKGESLSVEEKKLLRLDRTLTSLKAQTWSKLSATMGSVLLTIAAAAVFAAALTFPPVAIALTVATIVFSVVAIYKRYQEKKAAKEVLKINNKLENDDLTKALHLVKREKNLAPDDKLTSKDHKESLDNKLKSDNELEPNKRTPDKFSNKITPEFKRHREETEVNNKSTLDKKAENDNDQDEDKTHPSPDK